MALPEKKVKELIALMNSKSTASVPAAKPIIEMFGLSGSDYPGVMDFMSSLLADLPAKFGASIFKSYGIEETGFSKDRVQVKRRM